MHMVWRFRRVHLAGICRTWEELRQTWEELRYYFKTSNDYEFFLTWEELRHFLTVVRILLYQKKNLLL